MDGCEVVFSDPALLAHRKAATTCSSMHKQQLPLAPLGEGYPPLDMCYQSAALQGKQMDYQFCYATTSL